MISLLVRVAKKPDFVTSEQLRCRTEYASVQSDHRLYFSLLQHNIFLKGYPLEAKTASKN